ncbi:uncharacterized protein [Dendrobates tinctorius]|uniref:uncharacterized protein n=1 Tax=Dendrobates tinctorius TaxID=92724 RepID=UPI003CC944E4
MISPAGGAAAGTHTVVNDNRRPKVDQQRQKKMPYLYMERLNFLALILDLRPTDSNIMDRATASESNGAFLDHVDHYGEDAGAVAGQCSDSGHPPTTTPSTSTAATTGEPAPTIPLASGTEEAGERNSSSSTLPLDHSPIAAPIHRRVRRRREIPISTTRREVDTGVLEYFSCTVNDDGEEAFAWSLARYMQAIDCPLCFHAHKAIHIILDLCTKPNNPREVFAFLDDWYRSPSNRLLAPDKKEATSGPTRMTPPHYTPRYQQTSMRQQPLVSGHIPGHRHVECSGLDGQMCTFHTLERSHSLARPGTTVGEHFVAHTGSYHHLQEQQPLRQGYSCLSGSADSQLMGSTSQTTLSGHLPFSQPRSPTYHYL